MTETANNRAKKPAPQPEDGIEPSDGKAVRAAKKAMPHPETRAVVADVAMRSMGRVMRQAATSQLLSQFISNEARRQARTISLGGSVLGIIAARVATRSVPGLLFVGSVLAGKAIYDYRKAKGNQAKAGLASSTDGDALATANSSGAAKSARKPLAQKT